MRVWNGIGRYPADRGKVVANGTIDEPAEQDCYATVPPIGSNEVTMETREVTITLTGQLASDNTVQASATHSVRVRNNVLRTW